MNTNTPPTGVLWVDPSTGEILDHDAKDFDSSAAVMIPVGADPDPADVELEYLGDYISRQYLLLDAEISALQEQCRRRVQALSARKKYLGWQFETPFRNLLEKNLEGGTKKSRDFSHGRAGFRTSKRIEVSDPDAAMGWASMNCTEAIKRSSSLIKSKLPIDMVEDGSVPGVARVVESKFYINPTKGK